MNKCELFQTSFFRMRAGGLNFLGKRVFVNIITVGNTQLLILYSCGCFPILKAIITVDLSLHSFSARFKCHSLPNVAEVVLISIRSVTANRKSGRSWFCEFSIFVLIVWNSFVLGCFGSRCGNIGRHLREWIFLPPLAKGTFALYFPRGSQSFSGSNPFPETQLFLTN